MTAPPADPVDGGGITCMLIRGGTSKGAYFLAADLPDDAAVRDDLLLRIMGTPDPRQIDGIGGAHPLTSKVAIVGPAEDPAADVDYLFLQVGVDLATVSDRQTCGNLLAGVGPFAVERGLVVPGDGRTSVRVRMLNSGDIAVATFRTPGGRVDYRGDTEISGVPSPAAAVLLDFGGGEVSRAPFPTGRVRDLIDGLPVTCVDSGMPTVVIAAASLGVTGYETPAELEALDGLRGRLRSVRLRAGRLMGLGDVTEAPVPKLTLVSAPRDGGALCTRSFIPVRCHASIGVLCAVSVATAALVSGTVAHTLAELPADGRSFRLEHPTGHLDVEAELSTSAEMPRLRRSAIIRTARKLFDGTVFPRPTS